MLDGISYLGNEVSWEENTEVGIKSGLFYSSEEGFGEREKDGFADGLGTGILEGNKDGITDTLEKILALVSSMDCLAVQRMS